MRFMVMHKVDADMEAGAPPKQEIISAMGSLVRESLSTGVFQNGAGLHRSAQRVRLAFRGAQRSVTHGPFSGQNELVWAFAMIQVPSMEVAIEQAARYASVLGDTDIEIGPVVEPWDLGLIPKPAQRESSRFLLLFKGNADSERGLPEPKILAGLAELEQRMTSEGALLAAEKLAPSSLGARLPAGTRAKRAWVDGPFAESKELIAGFSILNLPSKAEALAWADRYAAILNGNEVDVREIL